MDIDDISPGSILCGDLISLGWSVIKSVLICERLQTSISDIANQGEWKNMETNSFRRQKYNIHLTKKSVSSWVKIL